jgi:hypothetical protein
MTHELSQMGLVMPRIMVNSFGFLLRFRDLGHPSVAGDRPACFANLS